ncbi:MAG: hypothetical protein R6V32_06930, partial [Bacteroidales bacterium]
ISLAFSRSFAISSQDEIRMVSQRRRGISRRGAETQRCFTQRRRGAKTQRLVSRRGAKTQSGFTLRHRA